MWNCWNWKCMDIKKFIQCALLWSFLPHEKYNEFWFLYESLVLFLCPFQVLIQHIHANSFKYNSRTVYTHTSDSAFAFVVWYCFANVSPTNRGNIKLASAYIWKKKGNTCKTYQISLRTKSYHHDHHLLMFPSRWIISWQSLLNLFLSYPKCSSCIRDQVFLILLGVPFLSWSHNLVLGLHNCHIFVKI